MSMIFDPKQELDHIAEFADSGVRVFQRQGSLVGIRGAYGLKRWLYAKWRNRGNAVYKFVGTPRSTIIGHTVGIAAGVASLALFGLLDAPSVYVSGVTLGRVGAIALAVALTGGILRLVRSAHPPAGATTIIVASGPLARPRQLLDILIGVLLLTIAGWCLNRLMGEPAPVWAAPR